jgi:hypothetical protein
MRKPQASGLLRESFCFTRLAKSISKPELPVVNIKSFVVENGRPGVKPA